MKKYILILVAVMIVAFGAAAVVLLTTNEFKFQEHQVNQSTEYEVGQEFVSVIKIDAVSSDINILSGESDVLEIDFSGVERTINDESKYELVTDLQDGILSIEVNHKNLFIDFGGSDLDLNIYMPEYFMPTIEVETVSGDIYSDIAIIDFDIECETVSGDINMDNFAGQLNASTVSGDVILKYAFVRDNLYIDTVSGDINLSLPNEKYLSAYVDTVSGDIDDYFNDNFNGPWFDVENNKIKTVSGDVIVNEDELKIQEDNTVSFENPVLKYKFNYSDFELNRIIRPGNDIYKRVVFSNLHKESYQDIDDGEVMISVGIPDGAEKIMTLEYYKKYLDSDKYATHVILGESTDNMIYKYDEDYVSSYYVVFSNGEGIIEMSIFYPTKQDLEDNKYLFDQIVDSFEFL